MQVFIQAQRPHFMELYQTIGITVGLKRLLYCVEDSLEQLVGLDKISKGASPRKMIVTNISDELKISTNGNAKVIGVSMKDRAAVLMAGHVANGAYWFDIASGNFISSTFYMKQLPEWVKNFNNAKHAAKYLENIWNPLLDGNSYLMSASDENDNKGKFEGQQKFGFPYNLKELAGLNPPLYNVLYYSPFANSLLTDFAIETIKKESLGQV